MSELVTLLRSSYLYEVEIAKSKLASRDIPSYVKNEFVNNVAVFPMSQNYVLLISENDLEEARKILEEDDTLDETEML
ncbi:MULTISPECIES: putative signal transducing protein [Chryseobacterium]|uniref:putative signal transducing protein n=1 Tax=Chryseobacterium sp. R2A-55 TaxID=2744445 RepID=UPI001F282906|nr:DUF2007 domain-containing protein [Chryseobacterium sp. R2A-55]